MSQSAESQARPALDVPHDSIEHLSQALDAAPLDIGLHGKMLEAMRTAGDEAGFAAHQIALAAFAAFGTATPRERALALYNLATVYSLKGRPQEAIRWYRHTLTEFPQLAIAHQNLAVLLADHGDPELAERHRERAYTLQRVFVEPAIGTEQRRLLILSTGKSTGNVPLDALLTYATTTRIKYAIDYASQAEDEQLPPYDLVLNAIGDPDIAQPLAERIAQFTHRCGRPVLNSPEAVARTHRHRMPARLARIDHTLVPRCIRLETMPASPDDLTAQLAEAKLDGALLLRPIASHGGDNLALHTSMETLWPALGELGVPCYLTAYHDFRSLDGHFRKYRIIYVDREPYPYHLAISPNWMVHYFSAGMLDTPWKLDEERRFLADPRAALGARAMDAIIEIGYRLDLDYGGIDFTLTPDGQVLVFEANATMLVHREKRDGPLAHKNPYIEHIAEAFERMQREGQTVMRNRNDA
ncbi:ATP-grasp domain-containing protein [Trinickia acidisoli]|uniref:ATP-grasp domain-containing protein n=1 Tax=Trinickia acidisoli TaxID=2767482 RepID=UPI001A8CD443|nr:hypothetical protein [Trinickia acidisoli]